MVIFVSSATAFNPLGGSGTTDSSRSASKVLANNQDVAGPVPLTVMAANLIWYSRSFLRPVKAYSLRLPSVVTMSLWDLLLALQRILYPVMIPFWDSFGGGSQRTIQIERRKNTIIKNRSKITIYYLTAFSLREKHSAFCMNKSYIFNAYVRKNIVRYHFWFLKKYTSFFPEIKNYLLFLLQ